MAMRTLRSIKLRKFAGICEFKEERDFQPSNSIKIVALQHQSIPSEHLSLRVILEGKEFDFCPGGDC